jgi:hypothetical protein
MSSKPTEAEWHASLAGVLGEAKATALITAMKQAHLEKSIRTLSYGVSGLLVRNNVSRMSLTTDINPRLHRFPPAIDRRFGFETCIDAEVMQQTVNFEF